MFIFDLQKETLNGNFKSKSKSKSTIFEAYLKIHYLKIIEILVSKIKWI